MRPRGRPLGKGEDWRKFPPPINRESSLHLSLLPAFGHRSIWMRYLELWQPSYDNEAAGKVVEQKDGKTLGVNGVVEL